MFTYASTLPLGIKLVNDSVVRKNSQYSLIESVAQARRVVKHFIKNPHPMVVPVYSWEDNPKDRRGLYKYSYTMKRMCVLSTEEKHIVHHCCNVFGQYSDWKKILIENSKVALLPYMEKYSSLISFMETAISKMGYIDSHNNNFMKNEIGDYQIIDLEGFLKFPVDTRKLDWLSKEE